LVGSLSQLGTIPKVCDTPENEAFIKSVWKKAFYYKKSKNGNETTPDGGSGLHSGFKMWASAVDSSGAQRCLMQLKASDDRSERHQT